MSDVEVETANPHSAKDAKPVASVAPITLEPAAVSAPAKSYHFAEQVAMVRGNEHSADVESIGALRAQLLSQHLRLGRRALTILSPASGAGATFTAVNLAVSMAQAGIRTLLIDANMRDPGVQDLIIPHDPVIGLSHCLEMPEGDFGNVIQEDVMPMLSVIYAGQPSANAQELLVKPQLSVLFDMCLREYEITIVDTPASNTCADGQLLATQLRYGMIVVRKNESYVNDVKTLVGELKANGVELIGTVINEV
ncbi:MAG: CpsD/CapB family tyrosine-protein kinase [Pseudomonadota bacterium]